jgi:hypothetical protein
MWTTVATLCSVLAAQASGTTAATDTAVVDSGKAVRGRVVIACDGSMRFGPPGPAQGRCTITGAITDRGWFRDRDVRWVHPHIRTFKGRKGTIDMSVYEERGHWRIVAGTKAYARLRGRGYEALLLSLPAGISFTMTGRVWTAKSG